MPMTDVAFAAGFASVRQFNDTVREVFAGSPTELRTSRAPGRAAGGRTGTIALTLPARGADRARRAVRLPRHARGAGRRGVGRHDVPPHPAAARAARASSRCAPAGAARVVRAHARLAGATCRPPCSAAAGCSTSMPTRSRSTSTSVPTTCSAPLVRKRPGLRSPGVVDGAELLVRAILGQQVSVAGARDDRRPARRRGRESAWACVPRATDGSRRCCSRRRRDCSRSIPASLPFPQSRRIALRGACAAIVDGRLSIDAGRRPERAGRGAAGAAGDRPVDGELRRDARARRSRRVHADRPRRAARARAPRAGGRPAAAQPRSPSAGARGGRTPCTTCGRRCEHDQRTRRRRAMLHSRVIPSPVGELTLVASDARAARRAVARTTSGRVAVGRRDDAGGDPAEARADPRRSPSRSWRSTSTGERTEFDVPLDPHGTPFQLAAWKTLRTIPFGETISYGEQARAMGDARKAACRRRRERPQPAQHLRPVPPRRRLERQAHRLRRRPRREGLAPRPRTPASCPSGLTICVWSETAQERRFVTKREPRTHAKNERPGSSRTPSAPLTVRLPRLPRPEPRLSGWSADHHHVWISV